MLYNHIPNVLCIHRIVLRHKRWN